jgi:hypothetical protein
MFYADFSKIFTLCYNLQYCFLTLVQDVQTPAIDGQMLQWGDSSVLSNKSFWFPISFLALFFLSPDDVSDCKCDSYITSCQPVLKGKSHIMNLPIYPTLKKISVMHVIKLGFAPVSFPPG